MLSNFSGSGNGRLNRDILYIGMLVIYYACPSSLQTLFCKKCLVFSFLLVSFAMSASSMSSLFGIRTSTTWWNENNRIKSLVVKCDRNNNGRTHNSTSCSIGSSMVAENEVTKQRRVVVTGMGVMTTIGQDPNTFYANLLEGMSGITKIESFDCSQLPTKIGGEIKDFNAREWTSPKQGKRIAKFIAFAIAAGKKALADGGVTDEVDNGDLDKTRCGVLIGSAVGGMEGLSAAHEAYKISYKKISPFLFPFSTLNMAAAFLAMDLGWMGPNYSITAACATSNHCILNAAKHIIKNEADLMLCGGSDAGLIPFVCGSYAAGCNLSERNHDPARASRPWDSARDGFVLGEGAGILLLEELEHAKRRGARIYAELLGGSFCSDGYLWSESNPDGSSVAFCMEQALQKCGVAKEDVNYINAHAASTQIGDAREYNGIVRCFGNNPQVRVNSMKSMVGHLLGASGAVEAVATIKAIETGWIHPNINLENPDKDIDMNMLVGDKKERVDIKVAMSNSFGFQGQNSSILFAPFNMN